MPHTEGLNITFTRCNDPSKEAEWSAWYDDIHLPDVMATGTCWVATRWELIDRPVTGYPALGFTHLNVKEVEGPDVAANMLPRNPGTGLKRLKEQGRMFPNQGVIDIQTLKSVGRWSEKPEPTAETKGLFCVFATCTDSDMEDEWNDWYDNVHVPDILDTGRFRAATRWVRLERRRNGTDYLALYEVADDDIAGTVGMIGDLVPKLFAQGRMHSFHCAGMRFATKPAGKWTGRGFRAENLEASLRG